MSAALEQPTADGMVFRVDLRLRPEGRNGPLCNSLAAAEAYYETFGRTWERQAWLRARPAAGDRALGDELLAMLEPFIYPRSVDAAPDRRRARRCARCSAIRPTRAARSARPASTSSWARAASATSRWSCRRCSC